MYLKIHETEAGRIVAVCDEDLLGQVLTDGKTFLDLKKYEDFYNGKKVKSRQIKAALKSFSSANIVGKESIAAALSTGLVSESYVKYIKNIPYVQVYKI